MILKKYPPPPSASLGRADSVLDVETACLTSRPALFAGEAAGAWTQWPLHRDDRRSQDCSARVRQREPAPALALAAEGRPEGPGGATEVTHGRRPMAESSGWVRPSERPSWRVANGTSDLRLLRRCAVRRDRLLCDKVRWSALTATKCGGARYLRRSAVENVICDHVRWRMLSATKCGGAHRDHSKRTIRGCSRTLWLCKRSNTIDCDVVDE